MMDEYDQAIINEFTYICDIALYLLPRKWMSHIVEGHIEWIDIHN